MGKDFILVYLTIWGIFSYIPQIIKVIRNKSSEDISITTWFIWSMNAVLYLIYLILADVELKLILMQCLDIFFIVTTLLVAIVFNKSIFKKLRKDKDNKS